MKLGKTIAKLFSFGALAAVLPCLAAKAGTTSNNNNENGTVLVDRTHQVKLANYNASSVESALFGTVLENIATSGSQILTSATGVGVKYLVTNILKDYGIDIRDASVKYLERIDNEIQEVKNQLKTLSAATDKYNAERSLDNLYSYVNYAATDVMNQVKGGLWSLVNLENDSNNSEEYIEKERKNYYETSLKNFTVKGSNISDFVTHFANTIITPVDSAPTNDVFYYYQLTNGQFDKWSTQSYTNRRKYIAYLDTLLLSSANLAIYDYHYRNEGADVATKATNEERFNTMIASVNEANALFQKELNRLEEYETLRKKGEIIYLPTNTHYSTKLATYTFNHDDKERQQVIKGVEYTSGNIFHYGKKYLQNYLLTYQANHNMVNNVVADYENYTKAYGLTNYTINQYLKDIGFTAERQDLFDKANGLYYGELNIGHSGYLNDDLSVKVHYYDKFGKYQNKTQYFVEAHHGFLTTNYQVKYSDNEYYLCFVKADGKLDGAYWGNVYAKTDESKLINAFGEFLKNRVSDQDPVVKNVKYQ